MPKPPASAVYRCARREPLPLRPKEYPRERRPSRAGCWLGNGNGDESQEQCRVIRDTRHRGDYLPVDKGSGYLLEQKPSDWSPIQQSGTAVSGAIIRLSTLPAGRAGSGNGSRLLDTLYRRIGMGRLTVIRVVSSVDASAPLLWSWP